LVNGQGVRVPLVVHGGTGLPPHTVAKLIEVGGAKFNVSTELKRTLIDAKFNYISEHREEYNPGKVDRADRGGPDPGGLTKLPEQPARRVPIGAFSKHRLPDDFVRCFGFEAGGIGDLDRITLQLNGAAVQGDELGAVIGHKWLSA
jgi:hypothetical protein